jgi:hypothetical protein
MGEARGRRRRQLMGNEGRETTEIRSFPGTLPPHQCPLENVLNKTRNILHSCVNERTLYAQSREILHYKFGNEIGQWKVAMTH